MVVAAGLSPAWQQVLVFDEVQLGAVNRARQSYWCGSGKVINVGLALHHLSGGSADESLILSTLGGAAFDAIDQELASLGAGRRWIKTRSPTRICTTIVNSATGEATELVENAFPVTAEELATFKAEFAEAAARATAVVLTGSLPPEVPVEFFRKLLAAVDCPTVLDIRGPELLAAVKAQPTLVKPNREELAATLQQPINDVADLKAAIAELQRRGAQAVVVTAGADEAWLGMAGEFHRFTPPRVERLVNPIGCGDCLAAGLAWGLAHGRNIPTALTEGLALAAENAKTLLPSDFDGRRLQALHR